MPVELPPRRPRMGPAGLALAACAWAPAAGLSLRAPPKPGEGIGHPLFEFSQVQIPDDVVGKRRCVRAHVDKASHSLTVDPEPNDASSVAWGCFTDTINTTGWTTLAVHTSTSADVPTSTKIYAAGFIEGLLTQRRIVEFRANVLELMTKDATSKGAKGAVERALRVSLIAWEQFAGGNAMLPPDDPVEAQAWVALLQMRGLRDGYNLAAYRAKAPQLSAYDFLVLNSHAEIPDITQMYAGSAQAKLISAMQQTHGSPASSTRWLAHKPRGSALVKRLGPAGDARDLLVGHVTWGDYGQMTRVWKNYYLDIGTPVSAIAMSSYPGCISSTDDYFLSSTGVAVASTHLGVPPGATPGADDGLPSFLKAIAATRLAQNPHQWSKIYGYIPGIAGGKQFLIADYGLLVPKSKIKNGTLFMVDALPRMVRAADVTEQLRTDGYFQSHGDPHFLDVRAKFEEGPKLEGARASLLALDAAKISNIGDARGVLVNSLPGFGDQRPVSARYDLAAENPPGPPLPAGGIDAKVANRCLVYKLSSQATSGPPPTLKDGAFTWTEADGGTDKWPGWPREGLPDKWDFGWVDAGPNGVAPPTTKFAECGTGSPAR